MKPEINRVVLIVHLPFDEYGEKVDAELFELYRTTLKIYEDERLENTLFVGVIGGTKLEEQLIGILQLEGKNAVGFGYEHIVSESKSMIPIIDAPHIEKLFSLFKFGERVDLVGHGVEEKACVAHNIAAFAKAFRRKGIKVNSRNLGTSGKILGKKGVPAHDIVDAVSDEIRKRKQHRPLRRV